MPVRQGRILESLLARSGAISPRATGFRGGVAAALVAVALVAALPGGVCAVAAAPEPPNPASSPPGSAPPTSAATTTAPAATSAPAPAATPPAPSAASPVASAPAAPPAPAQARDHVPALSDLDGWLEYRTRNHIAALPLEARLFYRRGILASESGNLDEAARLVRGAAELDPTYVSPHLTLAAWSVLRDPSQTLMRYGIVLELARQNFLLQLALAANAVYFVLQAIFLGFLATGILIVLLRHPELRHPWREQLARVVSPVSATAWSWAFMVLPFVLGFGPALPTLVMLALLWPVLRGRERMVFVVLVASLSAMPWLTSALDRLTLPLDESRGPLYGVAMVETDPADAHRAAQLRALSDAHPDNPFVSFAAGWTARRSGDLHAAEGYFRRTLTLWPEDDRALNNLGTVLMMQGRADEALDLFERATRRNPANAAAWFNQSEVFTQRYDFRSATEALSHASALNFDLVKTTQAQATEDGMLPLVDQWIAPTRMWVALSSPGAFTAGHGALPPGWRERLETRGWTFTGVLLALVALALWAGAATRRALPLRTCSNCGTVVCRRCAERRRELALCPACAAVEKRAESPDFARVLLQQHRRRGERLRHLLRTAMAALVPGLGLLAFRRAFTPLLLLTATAALVGGRLGAPPPFAFEPRVAVTGTELPGPIQLGAWILIYAWSVLGYFRMVGRARVQASLLAAPTRSRSVQATARTSPNIAA
jgi:tetratricopeptide (TPR) repeat protein